MNDVWLVTNWQALQFVRDPTPISRINQFQPFQCDYSVSYSISLVYFLNIFIKKHFINILTFLFRIVQRNAITRRCAICGTNRAYDTCEHANRAPKSIHGPVKQASDHRGSTTKLKNKLINLIHFYFI